MFEQLFGSRTRVKVLNLFLNNEERTFYVREITRKIDEQINSVRRELAILKSLGLLTNKVKSGKLYYAVNTKADIFPELKSMFSKISKEIVSDKRYIQDLRKLGTLRYAALMGKFVSDHDNRVDLFLVGDISKTKLEAIIKDMENDLKKEVNYSVFTYDEYKDREMLFDRFITEVLSKPKEVIIDTL